MKRSFIVICFAVSVLLVGCKPSTVMQKLESDQRYEELTTGFWAKELTAHSSLWNEALAYCVRHPEKINCASVTLVDVIHRGSRVVPAYGSSGTELKLPDFK